VEIECPLAELARMRYRRLSQDKISTPKQSLREEIVHVNKPVSSAMQGSEMVSIPSSMEF